MPKANYTPDGDRIPRHEHDWIMADVTLHPNPDIKRPLLGATVLWRCQKRNCGGYRKAQYQFRKPRRNQQPNSFSPSLDSLLAMDVRQVVQSEAEPIEA